MSESKYQAGFGVIISGQNPLTFIIPIYSTIVLYNTVPSYGLLKSTILQWFNQTKKVILVIANTYTRHLWSKITSSQAFLSILQITIQSPMLGISSFKSLSVSSSNAIQKCYVTQSLMLCHREDHSPAIHSRALLVSCQS